MTGENKGSNSTGGAHPKSAQPRGKRSDGATSSTFIKPPTPPDRAIWGKKIQSKQEEFNDLKKKLEEVMEKLVRTKVVDPEREHFYEQQKKLTQRMQEVQTVIREEREKRSVITKSMRDIRAMREELEHKLHELTGQLGTFKSIDEIEEALNFITLKMETGGSGSLRQEKEYLRRRKLLEAAKEQVAHLKPLRENIEHCSDKELSSLQEAKVLQRRLDELNAELRGVLQEKQSAVVPVSKVREEQAQARKERDEIRACMTRVRAEIDALRSERQAENEAYQKKREEWKLQVEAVKKAAAEERERRLEERKAQAERYERERQEEQVKLRLNPYEKEIDTCQQLLMYLESKMKRQGVSSATTQRRPPPSAPVRNPAAPTGTGELLKKESEDQKDWLYQDRRKKKGAEKSHTKPQMSQPLGQDSSNSKQLKDAPSLNQPLKHDFHHLADFERVGVHAPMGTNAIPKTIEALKERLEHFRSFIRTLEELKAEDAAAAAATAATTTTAVAEMGSATAMSEVDTKTSTEDKE